MSAREQLYGPGRRQVAADILQQQRVTSVMQYPESGAGAIFRWNSHNILSCSAAVHERGEGPVCEGRRDIAPRIQALFVDQSRALALTARSGRQQAQLGAAVVGRRLRDALHHQVRSLSLLFSE